MERKIKFQADSIEDLNKTLKKKDEKIFDLEKNYKVQIEYLKNYFGFKGKIEVLLSGDVNTKEFKEASKIREAKEDTLVLNNLLVQGKAFDNCYAKFETPMEGPIFTKTYSE